MYCTNWYFTIYLFWLSAIEIALALQKCRYVVKWVCSFLFLSNFGWIEEETKYLLFFVIKVLLVTLFCYTKKLYTHNPKRAFESPGKHILTMAEVTQKFHKRLF